MKTSKLTLQVSAVTTRAMEKVQRDIESGLVLAEEQIESYVADVAELIDFETEVVKSV